MITANEIFILRALFIQVIAAVFGAANIALANYLFENGRIRPKRYSIWMACSITGICIPVMVWTSTVFLGVGALSDMAVGILACMIFSRAYRNLPSFPSSGKFAGELPPVPPWAADSPLPPKTSANRK